MTKRLPSINDLISPPERKAVTLQQAAERWSVSVDFLERRIHDGTLPAYKAGKRWRVKLADLDALFPRVHSSGGDAA